MNDKVPEIIHRQAADLGEGDIIAPGFLPTKVRSTVALLRTFRYPSAPEIWWTVILGDGEDGVPTVDWFLADAQIPLELPEGAVGLDYQRDTEPEQVEVPADALVVAVGRAAVRPPDPFRDVDEVFGLTGGHPA